MTSSKLRWFLFPLPLIALLVLGATMKVGNMIVFDDLTATNIFPKGGRMAGVVLVAASNSPAIMRAAADYLCSGTNDQGILQIAISNNPSILLAPGDFYLNKTNFGGIDGTCFLIRTKNNWKMRGSGSATRLRLNTHRTNSLSVFDIRNCTNVAMSDFDLDCGADGATSYLTNQIDGVDFLACQNVSVENLTIKNGQGNLLSMNSVNGANVRNILLDTDYGPHILNTDADVTANVCRNMVFDSITITNDLGGAAKLENVRGCRLVNSRFAATTNGLALVVGANDTTTMDLEEGYYVVANNHFFSGIQFNGSGSLRNSGIIFTENSVEGYIDIGASIYTNQFDSLIIANNTMNGWGTNRYAIVGDDSCAGLLLIEGNVITGYTNGIYIPQQPAGGFAKASIRDNHLTDIHQTGIQVAVSSPSIQNNSIHARSSSGQDTSYRAISIDSLTNAFVSGNQINDFHEGLYVTGSSFCQAQGNYFSGTNCVNAINDNNTGNSNNVFALNFFNDNMVSGKNLTVTGQRWSSTYISPINNQMRLGSDYNQKNYLTPNYQKLLQILVPSYAKDGVDAGLLALDVLSFGNQLAFGTGSSSHSPLNRITFYLGSGVLGSAGTGLGRITENGWTIGADSAPGYILDVRGAVSMTSTLAVGGASTFTNAVTFRSSVSSPTNTAAHTTIAPANLHAVTLGKGWTNDLGARADLMISVKYTDAVTGDPGFFYTNSVDGVCFTNTFSFGIAGNFQELVTIVDISPNDSGLFGDLSGVGASVTFIKAWWKLK